MPGEREVSRTLTVPAEPQALDRVHEALAELWLDAADVGAGDRMAFETALTEVAGNVVQHACDGPGLDLAIEICVSADRIEAHLRDRGRRSTARLDEATLPEELAESGRGLAIALAVLDELVYRREAGVNHWRLARRRTTDGAPPA